MDEAILRISLGEDEEPRISDLDGEGFTITPLNERDPLVLAFLVSFSATAVYELLVAIKTASGRNSFSISLRRKKRHLTVNTNDTDLDVGKLTEVISDFLRHG